MVKKFSQSQFIFNKDFQIFEGRSFSKSNSTLQSNTQFSMGNQILRIYSANRTTDAGLYSCTAENSVSKISANARLNVKPGST